MEGINNCIILHGGRPKEDTRQELDEEVGWFFWLQKQLEKQGIGVEVPLMPKQNQPVYSEWKEIFDKFSVTENSVLVGHSAGCAFLVRWLGETKRKIKKLILVAPAKTLEPENQNMQDIYEFFIDSSISERVDEVTIIVSDDDMPRIQRSAEIYEKELGAEKIVLSGKGHFLKSQTGTDEFLEVLEKILD